MRASVRASTILAASTIFSRDRVSASSINFISAVS
jgi:hypothetical protein